MASDAERITVASYMSPVGELLLGALRDGSVCLCDWAARPDRATVDRRLRRYLQAEFRTGSTPLLAHLADRLAAYFDEGTPIDPGEWRLRAAGTPFQLRVWETLVRIPYGRTVSYRELAQMAGSPGAVRAVSAAVGANALSVLLPCHRVIGSDGSLTGYAGGLPAKRYMLSLETRYSAHPDHRTDNQ